MIITISLEFCTSMHFIKLLVINRENLPNYMKHDRYFLQSLATLAVTYENNLLFICEIIYELYRMNNNFCGKKSIKKFVCI
jgi:hypothetical protein